MNYLEVMLSRHSVRRYLNRPIEQAKIEQLNKLIEDCNKEGNLHFQLVTDDVKAFGGAMAKYGSFNNVRNYVAIIGKGDNFSVRAGYYGEKVVLFAQSIGLNTCWVALSYSKSNCKVKINDGEKLLCVIALGYGENTGTEHKNKPLQEVMQATNPPEWFINGVKASLLAPTAMNQQKFKIILHDNNAVSIKEGIGFYTRLDKGIVKYHFELGAGLENFNWLND